MRRLSIVALAVIAAALAAIWLVPAGAAEEERRPEDNDKALSYLPPGGMLLAQVPTDIESEAFRTLDARLVKRLTGFRAGHLLEDGADYADLIYDTEIRPQLGRDLAVAVRWPAMTSGQGLLAALEVNDGPAMRRLLDANRYLQFAGDVGGARLYKLKEDERGEEAYDAGHDDESEDPQAFLALEDDVLVAADSERRLRRAIARHDSGTGMNDASFRDRLGGLPRDALVRAIGDLGPLFAQRHLRRLQRIPWVRALRTGGATIRVTEKEIRADAVVNTDPSQVSQADLPVQPGDASPPIVGSLRQFSGASVNQSQTTVFLLRAARAAFPRSRFVRDVSRLERIHKIDFEREVLRQFNGPSATLLAPNGRFAARSAVSDPRRLARTIRRIAPDLGRVVEDLEALETEGLALLLLFAPDAPVSHGVLGRSRVKLERLDGQRDFYRLKGLRNGPAQVYFGLHRGVFVVGSSERRAKQMATASAQQRSGVSGASATLADLGGLRESIEDESGLDLGRLGQMTGSLNASPSRLRGSLAVELR